MIVLPDGKGDIDGVSGEKRGLLQALGHVPAESIEDWTQPSLFSPQSADGLDSFTSTNCRAIWVAAGRGEERDCGEFFLDRLGPLIRL
jgi:hypothetical protein